jgi:hypothetical protein
MWPQPSGPSPPARLLAVAHEPPRQPLRRGAASKVDLAADARRLLAAAERVCGAEPGRGAKRGQEARAAGLQRGKPPDVTQPGGARSLLFLRTPRRSPSSVLLPEPEGPISAVRPPAGATPETPLSSAARAGGGGALPSPLQGGKGVSGQEWVSGLSAAAALRPQQCCARRRAVGCRQARAIGPGPMRRRRAAPAAQGPPAGGGAPGGGGRQRVVKVLAGYGMHAAGRGGRRRGMRACGEGQRGSERRSGLTQVCGARTGAAAPLRCCSQAPPFPCAAARGRRWSGSGRHCQRQPPQRAQQWRRTWNATATRRPPTGAGAPPSATPGAPAPWSIAYARLSASG